MKPKRKIFVEEAKNYISIKLNLILLNVLSLNRNVI
jgi:hypothetical protein